MARSRQLLAVPFVAKDIPSSSNEFSNPDVRVGHTLLAYRYSGLRRLDFDAMLPVLRARVESEFGPVRRRPTSLQFAQWVQLAGGRVKGLSKRASASNGAGKSKR